jgi:hypothetical protein
MTSLADHLEGLGIPVEQLLAGESSQIDRLWLRTFAQKVKDTHGEWVYRGFRWHGFSYNLQPCLSGRKALATYREQWPGEFFVFDEALTECLRCGRVADYPDLSLLRRDVYVAHHKMKWTMVFTHEQPEIGPFFAARAEASSEPVTVKL